MSATSAGRRRPARSTILTCSGWAAAALVLAAGTAIADPTGSEPVASTPSPTPATASPTPATASPSTAEAATSTPSASPASTTPSSSSSPSATASASSLLRPGTLADLSLPRIPWEGGAAYYDKFPAAAKAGWTDPNHFPVVLWWGGVGSADDVAWDKSLGINAYAVLNQGTDYRLLDQTGMSYIGQGLDGQPRDDTSWVGDYLDDEVDGRMSAADGQAHLQQLVDKLPDHDKIRYANFTGMLESWYESHPDWDQASNAYASKYTDLISLDNYWFSGTLCASDDPHGEGWAVPFTKATCATAQNYGHLQKGLLWRLDQAKSSQPSMSFVENVDVEPDNHSNHALTPDEVKAAAMSTLIHEARGLIWFNQSFGDKCSTGNAVRSATNPDYPCRDTVLAMGQINNLAQNLAPVLNSQSYQWTFGDHLETMLKQYDGAAYLFAMTDDTTPAGQRTFTLPDQLKGHTITALGEDRTIQPNGDGTFTDTFATTNSYHVYRIA